MDTDDYRATTTTDNTFALNQVEELYETINILGNGAEALKDDAQRLNNELLEHERKLGELIENGSQVKVAVQEENAFLAGTMQNLEILHQDLKSLKEKVDEMQFLSYDGTLVWKIDKFQEKMSKSKVFYTKLILKYVEEV